MARRSHRRRVSKCRRTTNAICCQRCRLFLWRNAATGPPDLPPLAAYRHSRFSMSKQSRSYSDQYQDPRWQKKRLEVMERHGWKCQQCGTETKQLHVHHITYEDGKSVWEYDNVNFLCLCEQCHKTYHLCVDIFRRLLASCISFPNDGIPEVAILTTMIEDAEILVPPARGKLLKAIYSSWWQICNSLMEREEE